MEEKKVILESKIAHHAKMAEWAIEGQAKNKKEQAAWEDAHEGELGRQKRKIEDQARELKRLRQVVAGYEAHQQHQKKRKQDAENQRQRRRLHAQHPAVPTMTPESTTHEEDQAPHQPEIGPGSHREPRYYSLIHYEHYKSTFTFHVSATCG